MRVATILVGSLMFAGSAIATDADKHAAAKPIVVAAAAHVKQTQAAPARSVKAPVSRTAPVSIENDSSLNGYRLEREGCCGPQ